MDVGTVFVAVDLLVGARMAVLLPDNNTTVGAIPLRAQVSFIFHFFLFSGFLYRLCSNETRPKKNFKSAEPFYLRWMNAYVENTKGKEHKRSEN